MTHTRTTPPSPPTSAATFNAGWYGIVCTGHLPGRRRYALIIRRGELVVVIGHRELIYRPPYPGRRERDLRASMVAPDR